MPFKAIYEQKVIHSFEYDEKAWDVLKLKTKQKLLFMSCCGELAIPKSSHLGTQFFAHKVKGNCLNNGETIEHQFAKYLCAKTAFEEDWDIEIEKSGSSSLNEQWIADLICQKNKAKIAIEIQWSFQKYDDFIFRQERYQRSGVRGLWLTRYNFTKEESFLYKPSVNLPIFKLSFNKENKHFEVSGFKKINKCNNREPIVELSNFIKLILSGKIQWLPKKNKNISFKIELFNEKCWKCRRLTSLVVSIGFYIEFGLKIYESSIENLPSEFLEILNDDDLRLQYGYGNVKSRSSQTAGNTYISNGCRHCDALQGKYFLNLARTKENRFYKSDSIECELYEFVAKNCISNWYLLE